MKRFFPLLTVLGALATGCVSVSVNRSESVSGSPGRGTSLLETDRAFARLAGEKGFAAALDQYADNASVRLTPAGPVLRGAAALKADAAGLSPGALSWDPQQAEVSSDGSLGWTWGDYRLNDGGRATTGRYLTVWRKQGGSWRIAADIGSQSCP
ncbi:MAG: nuclear transport factor 2 family protein [Verrucomicrobiales bacterium]|nr:nuclear transport factor 2 family protein [Verrucomicrobiales bacterium]